MRNKEEVLKYLSNLISKFKKYSTFVAKVVFNEIKDYTY